MLAQITTLQALVSFVLCLAPAAANGQSPPDQTGSSSSASATVTVSPRQFERIQQAVSQAPALKLDEQQLRFYLEIVASRPTFADYARGYDFLNGPTKGGNPMSHDEFLRLVTPQEMYSSAGITASEQVQFALTGYLFESLIRKAVEELKQAKDERQAKEIRDRIDRELQALTGASRSRAR